MRRLPRAYSTFRRPFHLPPSPAAFSCLEHPALRFLGGQRLLMGIAPATLWNFAFGSVTVGQLSADGLNDGYYFGMSTSGGSFRAGLRRNFTTATPGDIAFGQNGAMNMQGPFENPETSLHMLEFFRSASGRAGRRDGVAMTERSGSNQAPRTDMASLIIGSNVNISSATGYFEGWIGELVVLGNCSDADVAAAGATLRPAWGL